MLRDYGSYSLCTFNNDKLMLSDTNIWLELHKHDDKLLLVNNTPTKKYKLRLEDMHWYVRNLGYNPVLVMQSIA